MFLRWVKEDRLWERAVVTDPEESAKHIQRMWRGFAARRFVEDLLAVRASGLRVYWTEEGEMVVIDLKDAAKKIQSCVRGFLARVSMDREKYLRLRQPEDKVVHGCTGGGKKNPLGTFFCSKKKNTVLASGYIFQKGGDHRWAVGIKSEEYCPTHVKIEKSDCYMCLCQCPSTIVARTRPYVEDGKSPIFTEELASKLIFT
jgi:hypothetical protein